jgi:nitrogenase subunit NifH
MENKKNLGIWMDHASANIMEYNTASITTQTIESKFTHQVKEDSLNKGESIMHNKENHQQGEYYKKLGEVIKNYDNVILFGPTDAKVELLNILKKDHHFSDIKIETHAADKMTENEQHAFVRIYFSKN